MQQLAQAPELDALLSRATGLAAAWGSTAAAATTIGQERAILRLFGVSGLSRDGRPLAAEVVDRYLGPDPRRLGGGIALPFAMAMAEYDLGPQELAMEVAAGNVDLGLEAELLAETDRRAIAMADASALARAAMDRMDANRTARRELLAVLGDPPRPWVGTGLGSAAIVDALDEARAAIDAGAELVRVDVPPSRELAERTAGSGAPVERWRAQPSSRGGLDAYDPSGQPIPTGAQRALAVLRRFVDEAGARRRGYVRIMTDAPALAAPDQAVVAAFERIDVVIADPMREVVAGRVDPDRAIADHVFAHRLLARAGTQVLVPAGPLIVARDLAAGVPSDPATRSGRALALQLLAVSLARRDGLAAEAVVLGGFPDWLVEESDAPARVAAEIAVRRALLPGHPIAFIEPPLSQDLGSMWHAIVGALLADAGDTMAIVRRPGASVADTAQTRGITRVAASLRASRELPELRGTALDHATRTIAAATTTLRALEDRGWSSLVDEPVGFPSGRLGAEAVAERTEAFDPIAAGGAAG